MATPPPPLPGHPRIVRHVTTRATALLLRRFAQAREGLAVVAVVSECRPLRDAPKLLELLRKFRDKDGWTILGLEQLEEIAQRAACLEDHRVGVHVLIENIADDLLIGGSAALEAEAAPGDGADARTRVARVLGLPQGMDLPGGFTLPLVGDADEARRFLRARFISDLAALKYLAEHFWLPSIESQFEAAASTDLDIPEEIREDLTLPA